MNNRPITKEQIKKIAFDAPDNPIHDGVGNVIGSSRALAKMCLILETAMDSFSTDIAAACEKLDKVMVE